MPKVKMFSDKARAVIKMVTLLDLWVCLHYSEQAYKFQVIGVRESDTQFFINFGITRYLNSEEQQFSDLVPIGIHGLMYSFDFTVSRRQIGIKGLSLKRDCYLLPDQQEFRGGRELWIYSDYLDSFEEIREYRKTLKRWWGQMSFETTS